MEDGSTLDARTLNRATLTRQLLLERAPLSAAEAVVHLVGVQAQEPLAPHVALWSRLRDFAPAELDALLVRREAVRAVLMRRTVHLVPAHEAPVLRGMHEALLEQSTRAFVRQQTGGEDPVDFAAIAAPGTELFADEPMISGEAARRLAHLWPQAPGRDLANVLATTVPLVQVPPRGTWAGGHRAPATLTTYRAWLGRDPAAPTEAAAEDLVLRYLRAHGPAATADVRAFSGMAGLPAAVERLGDRLRRFRDERGRTLLDVPDGPIPDPGTPAPVRYLPAFDNVVLGYHDRSRIVDDADKGLSVQGARFVLVDGRVAGTWTTSGTGRGLTLEVTTHRTMRRHERAEVREEGERLLQLLANGGRARGVRMAKR